MTLTFCKFAFIKQMCGKPQVPLVNICYVLFSFIFSFINVEKFMPYYLCFRVTGI